MNKRLIRLTEGDLHRIVKESVNKILSEGWIKDETESSDYIFNDIIATFKDKDDIKLHALRSGCSSIYEFLSDYIRDNYDVTLKQCDKICKMVKEHFNIVKFYYGE